MDIQALGMLSNITAIVQKQNVKWTKIGMI